MTWAWGVSPIVSGAADAVYAVLLEPLDARPHIVGFDLAMAVDPDDDLTSARARAALSRWGRFVPGFDEPHGGGSSAWREQSSRLVTRHSIGHDHFDPPRP